MIAIWPPADVWCFAKYRGVYVFGVVIVSSVARNSPHSCDCPRNCEHYGLRLRQNMSFHKKKTTSLLRQHDRQNCQMSNVVTYHKLRCSQTWEQRIIIKWCCQHFVVNDNCYDHIAGRHKILDNDWYFERISTENILKNHIKHTL